jgi:hypothetical protein
MSEVLKSDRSVLCFEIEIEQADLLPVDMDELVKEIGDLDNESSFEEQWAWLTGFVAAVQAAKK